MTAREIFKMVLVLTIVTGVWGCALSLVKIATQDQIEYQRIKNIKAPALKKALTVEYDNDPIKDRTKIVIGKNKRGKPIERTIFYAKNNNEIVAVALEAYGTGYDGDVGVMISITIPEKKIGSIAVTTHTETPGVGTKAINSQAFMGQFKDQPIGKNFSPSGGYIDAVTGATYTSHGIQKAVQKGIKIFKKNKSKILS
ncbi:MAG TPA: FMN-binding protein [Desulfohalobiaceae bacterium]|nr:FMN-binding protein [Desulfohalobiaceae bacterium]